MVQQNVINVLIFSYHKINYHAENVEMLFNRAEIVLVKILLQNVLVVRMTFTRQVTENLVEIVHLLYQTVLDVMLVVELLNVKAVTLDYIHQIIWINALNVNMLHQTAKLVM